MKQQRYKRLAPDSSATVDAASRVARYVFSDESVGRDMHTVAANAWQLDNFERNPVFLWFHDDSQPPIGRVFDLHNENRTLCGAVQYAETDFAESIYQLVRARYINAVSTSWQPLAWNFSRDKARPGGVDFSKVDLLEVSQVPVPSLPTALATARSRGLNVKPIAEWASRALDSAKRPPAARAQLEAIYRSANPRRSTSMVNDSAGIARRKRLAIALGLKAGPLASHRRAGGGESAPADAKALQKVQDHHKRCLEHHEEIGRANDATGDGLDQLGEVYKRLTSTLKDLGYGRSAESPPKLVDDLQRCMRSLTKAHEDSTEAHVELGDALGDASSCVDELVDDSEDEDE